MLRKLFSPTFKRLLPFLYKEEVSFAKHSQIKETNFFIDLNNNTYSFVFTPNEKELIKKYKHAYPLIKKEVLHKNRQVIQEKIGPFKVKNELIVTKEKEWLAYLIPQSP